MCTDLIPVRFLEDLQTLLTTNRLRALRGLRPFLTLPR
mgnify:CR=1 FL=1